MPQSPSSSTAVNGGFSGAAVYLGTSTGNTNATFDIRANTVNNALVVDSGSTGTLTLGHSSNNSSYNGAITLDNNLVISNTSGGGQTDTGGITVLVT